MSSYGREVKQLTLRGFDEELKGRLEELARVHSISLNRAALLLMRRGAGLAGLSGTGAGTGAGSAAGSWADGSAGRSADRSAGAATIGSGLDGFVGVWSEEEEREFLRSIGDLDRIDSELWE